MSNLNENTLLVLYFTAEWCGPCKRMAPSLQKLITENPDVIFTKLDIDSNEEIASKFSIKQLPSFVFIKNKNILHKFIGTDIDRLKEAVQKYR